MKHSRKSPAGKTPPLNLVVQAPASTSYRLDDDFLYGDASRLRRGDLLEIAWSTFRPGGLHAIELGDGRTIIRRVRATIPTARGMALEIQGSDEGSRQLLPRSLVRRVGHVRRSFSATPANVVQIGAWRASHPRPIRNLLFAEQEAS